MTTKKKAATPELAPATISEHDGVRYLHLGTPWVQGAMRIARPQAIELEYVQRMLAWMLWRPAAELSHGHAVQLGLGAGTLTRFCHQRLRMQRTTAVEINPSVIAACRQWFRLPADDARLAVVCADAGDWIGAAERAQTVSVLFVDLYDHDAAAPVLDDEAFYRDCRNALVDGEAGSPLIHAPVIEDGRTVGAPISPEGVTNIGLWARRKLRVVVGKAQTAAGQALNYFFVGFPIARAITARGFAPPYQKGLGMVRNTIKYAGGEIEQRLRDAIERYRQTWDADNRGRS